MLAAHINELVIKNGKLVYENSILKQQNQRQDKCTSAVFSNATSPLSTPVQDDDKQSMAGIVSSEEYRHLIDKYNSLNELHRESAQKVRYLERKNAAIMQKNREMKDSLPQSVSNQVTDDEVVTQHEPKSANRATTSLEDDIPQIVSERSLKRKRQLPATVAALPDRIPSDGTPVNPFRIKEEQSKLDFLMESGEDISPMRRHNGKLGARAARANFNRKLLTRSAMGTTSHNAKSMKSDMKVQSLAPSNGPRPALRSKPVTQLTLSDFRANPKFNHGYSYAFAETVRKRADRACLPGCTRAECCGSTFRTLATVAPALSFSQEEALLEEYLGDAYDSMNLTQMSADERRELVLQARTREMATKHGKHRQAYERHNTPPGYWRVDFPTTQESEEDAKKAREMERNQVEQRRIEAMRPGGRWIFRDEIIS
ncbi:SAE2-domain-containing protein [Polyplosphaeria fusca]|uniref:SAE2-domain-containing protein n=1 Tax=Polyplosphaeria fusca TaxID=682080 RepID=A0A9P4R2E5_9PLEO|nr:SAE2-domain-containing protein [Polyplosphaeria fusca]